MVVADAALHRAGGADRPPPLGAGYRLYGAEELQRLRTLRELLSEHDLGLGDVGFALRLSREPDLRGAVEAWLEARPRLPEGVPPPTGFVRAGEARAAAAAVAN